MSDLKVSEAARALDLHPDTLRALVRSGRFPNAYKTGAGKPSSPIRIPAADVEDFRRKAPRVNA